MREKEKNKTESKTIHDSNKKKFERQIKVWLASVSRAEA